MKLHRTLAAAACLVVLTACIAGLALAAEGDAKSGKVLRHVVLFKFKDGTTPEQIQSVEKGFAELPGKIGGITHFEWGTNVSTENMSQGFTHCFVVTFKTLADRDAYLPHPAHKEFVAFIGKYLDKALVVDYWAQE